MQFSKKKVAAAVAMLLVAAQTATYAATGNAIDGGINVRSGANTDSNIVGKLYKGDKIKINERIGEWYKCEYNGQETYVSTDYVMIMKVADGNVHTDRVPVHKQANTESEVFGEYYTGSTAVVTEVGDEWCQVLYYGDLGYVQRSYLDICNETPVSMQAPAAQPGSGSAVVDYAKRFIGTPYVSGGKSPSGFDCSGFTSYVYAGFGVRLNCSSSTQANQGVSVSRNELQPGDLVFFNTSGSGISHVAIYAGGGNIVHATMPGDTVKVSNMNSSYYSSRYVGARRVLN